MTRSENHTGRVRTCYILSGPIAPHQVLEEGRDLGRQAAARPQLSNGAGTAGAGLQYQAAHHRADHMVDLAALMTVVLYPVSPHLFTSRPTLRGPLPASQPPWRGFKRRAPCLRRPCLPLPG
jgi:hypothetical protein